MAIDEKSAILEIVNFTDGIDFTEEGLVEDTLSVAMEIEVLRKTQFGKRFLSRLNSLSKGECKDCDCILCGKPASSSVVCEVCLSNLRGSAAEYTRNAFKEAVNKVNGKTVKKNVSDVAMESGARLNNNSRDVFEEDLEINEDNNTEDLICNFDASTDRLPSRKAVKLSNRILMAILIISLLNTISIITIAIIVFSKLGVMG